jgi:FG-GAP-like repeat
MNKRRLLVGGASALVALGLTAALVRPALMDRAPDPPGPAADVGPQVHALCAACHAFPPPDSFPKADWKKEVEQGYYFAQKSGRDLGPLPPEADVVAYYEARAPARLPAPAIERASTPCPVHFDPVGDGAGRQQFAVSNVSMVRLFGRPRPEVLACDMQQNVVKLLRSDESPPRWEILAQAAQPAHAEVVDLDGDGIPDLLVACLGSFEPTDDLCGSVLWLRGDRSGKFTPVTLLTGVGRVADVRAADFDGDGKRDLVVAVFGWRETGSILLLENHTTDWTRPVFVPRVLDERHGAIHVPVAHLNGDGKPDFVALISQEHETVVAFLNTGDGFRKETIWTAPHPAYGSSGIELVDLDGDGDLDVLYTNGDSLDAGVIRPDHGVQWLENRGGFPFVHHWLAAMPGVHRAIAADFTGHGRLDVVAVSFLPRRSFPEQARMDSVILLEQIRPGQFVRHTIERGNCCHVSCAAGDPFGDGRPGFVTGTFNLFEIAPESVTVWRNRGAGTAPARSGKEPGP